jgi:cytochrome c peroxidase
MAYHQLGKELPEADVADIVAFLKSLTGEIPQEYIKKPELPANGEKTPGPDPT